MQPTRTYHDDARKFQKAYQQAALAFGIILGLNTVVMLGIGMIQLRSPNPEFGPPGVLLGMGAILAGVTIGITAAIARRQRWGAIVGVVVMALIALGAVFNWVSQAAESGKGPPTPVCGVIFFAVAFVALAKAIAARDVSQSWAPQPYASPEASAYNPYGVSAPPPATPRTLGTVGAALLIVGGLLVIGGAGAAVASFVAETTVSESAWQTVRDAELGVTIEMPGEPLRKQSPSSEEAPYEVTYTLDRHQYLVELSCTRLGVDWFFEEAEFHQQLEQQFDAQYVSSKSGSIVNVNGISMYRVTFQLKDGNRAVVQGFCDGRDAVIVSVSETEAVDSAVSKRVLDSVRRDNQ
jgi:hypothetical protein